MSSKRFGNQTAEQVVKHLSNLLDKNIRYNLYADPLGVYFRVTESTNSVKHISPKRRRILAEQQNMRPREVIVSNTKKRINPKIRSVKKGRTVVLKGRVW